MDGTTAPVETRAKRDTSAYEAVANGVDPVTAFAQGVQTA